MPTRLTVFGLVIPERLLSRPYVLGLAGACIATLAFLEWISELDVSLGVFYVLPVAIAATVLNHYQVVAVAVLCALVRDQFHPPLEPLETFLRALMATIAYGSAGLLVLEVFQNRQRMLKHYVQLRLETDLRRKAEQQLEILANDSPAGMVTIDANACVLGANRAAHEMFGFTGGRTMIGVDVSPLMPAFANALQVSHSTHLRTSAAGWATTVNGTQFPVMTWFSTYGSGADRCLAAVIVDTSEEVRDREHENLENMRDYNHLLAGAVSHEVSNMCSAISVVASNLKRLPAMKDNEDFRALRTLVQGLNEVAQFELHRQRVRYETCSVRKVLDQLRVVIEPDWSDNGGVVVWNLAEDALIDVHGAPHALLQTFLNVTQNSLRAVEGMPERKLEVRAVRRDSRVVISFLDSGCGVQRPEDLFHPFRSNADGAGLGLYISRALMESFSGKLVFVPTETGCRFDAILRVPEAPPTAVSTRIDAVSHADTPVHTG